MSKYYKKAMQRTFIVRQIAYKKGSKFLAVCLDLDLVAEGDTMGEAIDRLRDATFGYLLVCIKDNEPDKIIYRKAPKKYWNIYDLLQELESKKKPMIESFAGRATYNSSQINAQLCHSK